MSLYLPSILKACENFELTTHKREEDTGIRGCNRWLTMTCQWFQIKAWFEQVKELEEASGKHFFTRKFRVLSLMSVPLAGAAYSMVTGSFQETASKITSTIEKKIKGFFKGIYAAIDNFQKDSANAKLGKNSKLSLKNVKVCTQNYACAPFAGTIIKIINKTSSCFEQIQKFHEKNAKKVKRVFAPLTHVVGKVVIWATPTTQRSVQWLHHNIGSICHVASAVTSIALFQLGFKVYAITSLAILATGYLERRNYLPAKVQEIFIKVSPWVGDISMLIEGDPINKTIAAIEIGGKIKGWFREARTLFDPTPKVTTNLNIEQFQKICKGQVDLEVDRDHVKISCFPEVKNPNLQPLIDLCKKINWKDEEILKILKIKLSQDARWKEKNFVSDKPPSNLDKVNLVSNNLIKVVGQIQKGMIADINFNLLKRYVDLIAKNLPNVELQDQVDILLQIAKVTTNLSPEQFQMIYKGGVEFKVEREHVKISSQVKNQEDWQPLINLFKTINWKDEKVLKILKLNLSQDVQGKVKNLDSNKHLSDEAKVNFAMNNFINLIESIQNGTIKALNLGLLKRYAGYIAENLHKVELQDQIDILLQIAVEAGDYCPEGLYTHLYKPALQLLRMIEFKKEGASLEHQILTILEQERLDIVQAFNEMIYNKPIIGTFLHSHTGESTHVHSMNHTISILADGHFGLPDQGSKEDTVAWMSIVEQLGWRTLAWVGPEDLWRGKGDIRGYTEKRIVTTIDMEKSSLKEEMKKWALEWIEKVPGISKDETVYLTNLQKYDEDKESFQKAKKEYEEYKASLNESMLEASKEEETRLDNEKKRLDAANEKLLKFQNYRKVKKIFEESKDSNEDEKFVENFINTHQESSLSDQARMKDFVKRGIAQKKNDNDIVSKDGYYTEGFIQAMLVEMGILRVVRYL